MRLAAGAVLAAALLAWPGDANADHDASYRGEYANAFMAGRTAVGRQVTVMAGTHADFPYHHRGSGYDQVAVRLGGAEPLVLTARPRLHGLQMTLGERAARFVYAGRKLQLDLEVHAVRHRSRYEGDPAGLGDLLIGMGFESEDSPGLVYTPYELTGLVRGNLVLRGRRTELTALHGQAEAGRIEAPTDRRFQSAYDYAAAPTAAAAQHPYTFVGFHTRALHSGPDGVLDSYFRESGSDEFTLERGAVADGNVHGVPAPFQNRGALPRGARKLAQWAVDLGPGILYRKLVRLRDAHGRALEVLSETIEEDRGAGRDPTPPAIRAARADAEGLSLRLSEPALVGLTAAGRWRTLGDGRAGANTFAWQGRAGQRLLVRAIDESGNRSRGVRLTVRAGR